MKVLKILLVVLAFVLLFFAPHLTHLFERTQRKAVETQAIKKGLERLQKEQANQNTPSH
ncbi:hypothetical protein [Methylacidiphilum caldifontis]|uniref:hypothetical protein n=1 Tax=Methylacidiphilum caldifontis TaxID=2795386 RepID=UPI00141BDBEA|nr:hypothetical protein [Methylacidiphilum caldifontis]QSR88983.1 hypothetical protein IT6_01395 [Methylacidiphilum caldifontis]